MLELVQPDLIKPAVKNLPELPIKSCFQQAQLLCLLTSCFPLSLDLASDSVNNPASKQADVKDQHSTTLMKANICSDGCNPAPAVINVFQLFSMDALMQTAVLVSSCFTSHRWHESGGESSLNFSQHNNSQKTWKLLVKFRTECCRLCSVTLWKAHKDAFCEYLWAETILRFSHENPALWRIQDP